MVRVVSVSFEMDHCEQCCLIPEFTPECTNQCLVLACDDPDHATQSCLVADGTPCDDSCITAADCTDCPGLDEIVSTSPDPTLPPSPSS